METLNNVANEDYILLRCEYLTKEEYDEIIDLVKQVLRRNPKNEDRIVQELDMCSWMSLK